MDAIFYGCLGIQPSQTEVKLLSEERIEAPRHLLWQERIFIALELYHGDPCVIGTRLPVATIVASQADYETVIHVPSNES